MTAPPLQSHMSTLDAARPIPTSGHLDTMTAATAQHVHLDDIAVGTSVNLDSNPAAVELRLDDMFQIHFAASSVASRSPLRALSPHSGSKHVFDDARVDPLETSLSSA